MMRALFIGVLAGFWVVGAPAQVPAILHFDPAWCPRPEMLEDLRRSMNLRMNGCCIQQGLVFLESRESRGLAALVRPYLATAAAFEKECTGKVLSKEEADADDASRRRALELADEAIRRAEAAIAERAHREMPGEMTKALAALTREEFCVQLGEALRLGRVGHLGPHEAAPALAMREAAKRGVAIDRKGIEASRLRLGLDECQVLARLGAPNGRRRSVGAWGDRVVLAFDRGVVVTLLNGRVEGWVE